MLSKIIEILSYILAITGSLGMIVYRMNFGFSTNADGDKFNFGYLIKNKKLDIKMLRINAYDVWIYSWQLIIFSLILQLIIVISEIIYG